jgi:hypothetical protein
MINRTRTRQGSIRAAAYGFSHDPRTVDKEWQGPSSDYKAAYQATETLGKRPDILYWTRSDYDSLVKKHGQKTMRNLHRTADKDVPYDVLSLALGAIEIEHTQALGRVGVAQAELAKRPRDQRYLGIQLQRQTSFGSYLKDSDLKLLSKWREATGIPIFLAQYYCDDYTRLYPLSRIEQAIEDGSLPYMDHRYPEGTKRVWNIWYTLGQDLATCHAQPRVETVHRIGKRGKIHPELTMHGGKYSLTSDALANLTGNGEINPFHLYLELEKAFQNKQSITAAELLSGLGARYGREAAQKAVHDYAALGKIRSRLHKGEAVYVSALD